MIQKYGLWALLVCWLSATSAGIYWLGKNNFSEFDPNLRLSQAIMDLNFEQQVVGALQQSQIDTSRPSIIHIKQSGCFCETLSQAHIAELATWAKSNNVENISISLNDQMLLSTLIPSTPAIIVIGHEQELVYLGPYSQGLGCFQKTGFAELRIEPYFSGEQHAGQQSMIQSEANGCYCENSV